MDADLTELERILVQTLRAARMLYEDGEEASARKVLHFEAIPMMAACVQGRDLAMGLLTGASARSRVEA